MQNETVSLSAQCEELGRLLGLDRPVSEAVMHAAVDNETYINNLLICRRRPDLLEFLLANPPRPRQDFTTGELFLKTSKALLKWARKGFTVVDDTTYRRRLDACHRCPDLVRPPESKRRLYAAIGAPADDRAVCAQCGCIMARKARLATEHCPALHPEQIGYSRWEEPLVSDPDD